ncbi:tRNA wybutosine-synthesizing protein 2/3/4 isoform X2 [Rhodamnia argentea]|uniref:tRNA wybutosine-synthesizing protein 2/3/4 isoform X2 n=1 Tax=Rhodamnia argentea TaxID=178133 RepID=A0A8B8MKT4_9MYRT|nr:tRNA wybutosine-synthesizing protein 2/3/4 isoform X2 [Rhodamnia argentea]
MEFEKRKAAALASLGCSETDKSPKGSLDAPIVPLLTTINHHPSYFTTSSCSGRISILSQPPAAAAAKNKKARGGTWLYISHDPADPDSVLSSLFPAEPRPNQCDSSELVFRFEPLIVAVDCRDLSAAQLLVSTAIACGFRESGITSASKRVIVAIRCSIRMEVPLGDTREIVVSREYVKFLVGVANEKMEANRRRTEKFHQTLRTIWSSEGEVNGAGDEKTESVSRDAESLKECECETVTCVGSSEAGASLDGNARDGPAVHQDCSLSITPLKILGEPHEKLFLWGHSACTVDRRNREELLVFGGFGGMGRHARRNDCLLLDPSFCTLETIAVRSAPSPRMGHTASVVGDQMFVIGGRTDPLNILSDVWVFNTATNEWKLLNCNGHVFPPRHRHSAAVLGLKIFVYGGVNNESICSSCFILDTSNLCWEECAVGGDQPCARHSHSMVAYGSKVFMFGGYDGEKALGDLHSFDIQACAWQREKTLGKGPHARFSHSMFVYKHYIGIIGGCPVKQHLQELSLLDLQLQSWKLVTLNSVSRYLFVRTTVNIVGDDLVVIGGGASCYAFGTNFSEPMKINLIRLDSSSHSRLSDGDKHPCRQGEVTEEIHGLHQGQGLRLKHAQSLGENSDLKFEEAINMVGPQTNPMNWLLQVERNLAKLAKDLLKKFGWLDMGRKVYACEDGTHICFPVTEKFYALYEKQDHRADVFEELNVLCSSKQPLESDVLLNQNRWSAALNLLKQGGASTLVDRIGEVRKVARSPYVVMREAVAVLVKQRGLSEELLEQLPTRWERLGDIVVLPETSFKDPIWETIGEELWPIIAKVLNTRRLARQGYVARTSTRDSALKILFGDDGWVAHRENGILYSFDATKCMFSWGNLSEKLRMACLDCRGEVVVDLFAGIGYFVLPFLVRAQAKLVYACEWNPHAIEALRQNLQANSVDDRCVILEGDNRITAPKGVADRVCLGLLPSSEGSWVTAIRALRKEGGTLHVHGNVKDSEESTWAEYVSRLVHDIAKTEGHPWEIVIEHVERVKWYAPHIRHLVIDVRCRHIQS